MEKNQSNDPKLYCYISSYNYRKRVGIGTNIVLLRFEYVKVTASSQGQSSPTRPLIQNGYPLNHFVIYKSQFKKTPEFTGITGFVNTPASIKLADLKGKVVLVHFWTYTCINCIHTIPHLNDWYRKYVNKGLVIVGVQTPEFTDEKNIDNVKTAVNNFQIKYPVILGSNYAYWNAYGQEIIWLIIKGTFAIATLVKEITLKLSK